MASPWVSFLLVAGAGSASAEVGAPCLGCVHHGEVDEHVVSAARNGVGALNAELKGPEPALGLVKVHEVKKQVVSGMKYELLLEAAETSCSVEAVRSTETPAEDCARREGSASKFYAMHIVDAPWRSPRYTILSKKPVTPPA